MTAEVDIVNALLNRSGLALASIALATVALTACTPGRSSGRSGISSATTIDDLVKTMNAVYYAAK